LLALAAVLFCLAAPSLFGQSTQGAVNITVTDPAGAIVPDAKLELRAIATNDLRTAATQDGGTYRFGGLSIGNYVLTVTKEGFEKSKIDPVVVEAARVTDVSVQMQMGLTTTVVEVAAVQPVLETSSNMIGTTINLKQIEDLPLGGRDLTQLTHLAPGYNGTWNGLPVEALGNNFDGVASSTSRMKFESSGAPNVSPRIENIEEMTVQTDQIDMDQGFGLAATQMNFVTRSGTNSFHGRLYEDFRNSDLNANSWSNNVRGVAKPKLILNNFGGSVGGPIIKNKLFFFGSFSMSKQPGSTAVHNYVLTSAAQQGIFTYGGHQVNVLQIAQNSGLGLPSSINSVVAQELATINKSVGSGTLSAYSDPNFQEINWLQSNPITFYYPAGTIDYHATDKLRLHLAFNQTRDIQPSSTAPLFPGADFASQGAGFKSNNATFAIGVDYIISPTVENQFKGGFLYNPVWNSYSSSSAAPWDTSVGTVTWNFANVEYPFGNNMSGAQYNLPVSTYYPVITLGDTVSWQRNKHQFKFGFSGTQEQDHYWNAPGAIPGFTLGLADGDSALNAFTNTGSSATLPNATAAQLAQAEQLYAVLAGRISSVNDNGEGFGLNLKTKTYNHQQGSTYNLDERFRAWGLFAQDSFRVKPSLTVNFGLRWDFTGDDYDLTGAYHNATPADIYGPSGVGNVFQPGTLSGSMNPVLSQNAHAYSGWNVTPQPTAGFAWKPEFKQGVLGSLFGDHTVLRGGFSLRRFTDSTQYVWNMASDYGALYFQDFYLNPYGAGTAGSFAPGTLSLGQTLPALGYSPASAYQTVAPESQFTFTNTIGVNGLNSKIAQPYTETWNIGIQRELGPSRVLEVRYNANRARHLWIAQNINEVNTVENGFLTQFKAAQANLKINQQHNVTSFANNGYAGQTSMPIIDAAFKGNASAYSGGDFINDLNTGQVGAMANTLAGNPTYFCNLVGAGFSPCAAQGYTGAGAGYPINLFQANPYAAGEQVDYMDAIGYSNYNGLQIDFRQKSWHGIEFDANYTWSHNLGVASPNQWQSMISQYTIRNLNMNYGPALNDTRHVVHVMATVDLPFGKNRRWLKQGGIANGVIGGWTLGSITTFQTGQPLPTFGGNMTFNDYGDGGINLSGVDARTLQSSIGAYHVNTGATVDLLNPKYLTYGSGANASYINPNTTAGTFGSSLYLFGPHQTYEDMSLSKSIPITEKVRFSLQAEFLNIFNHPVFGWGNNSGFSSRNAVQSSTFGTGYEVSTPRRLELRANIQF
jgi:hypothetical protein